jgi:hypothetical protein
MGVPYRLGKTCQEYHYLEKHSALALKKIRLVHGRSRIKVHRISVEKIIKSITPGQDNKNIEAAVG